MKLRFSASEVTQEVVCKALSDSGYQMLHDDSGAGYRRSITRDYLSGIAGYLEKAKAVTGGRGETGNRILFLTAEAHIARQGYLVLRRELMGDGEPESREEDDEYGEFYRKSGVSIPRETGVEDTLLVSGEQVLSPKPEKMGAVELFSFGQFGRRGECEKGDVLEKAESVLVELGGVHEPDEAADWVLGLEKRWVAVWLKPEDSYEYLLKRLVFEGGFQVIELGTPSREDYLSYAMEYLEYHHFQAEPEAIGRMLDALQGYRGNLLAEKDIYLHLDRCMGRALKGGKRKLEDADIAVVYDGQGATAREELERVVGLEEVKEVLLRRVAAKRLMMDGKVKLHGNYIMEGPPGTGKSKMARLLAKLMAEAGISNGRFVDASRTDIIGKYLGHTAANVRAVFERAEGGVLFVDEASFLLGEDIYVREAVVEFVRYMELYPETTVIFATYPEEGRLLLECDPGFRSRIHQVLFFAPYTDEVLYQILKVMAEDYGFCLGDGCREGLYRYLGVMRGKKNFGNAREVRRLLETAIEEFGLRGDAGCGRTLAGEDVEKAADYLLKNVERGERSLGFVCN